MKNSKKHFVLLFIFVSINAVFGQEKEKLGAKTFTYRSTDPHMDDPEDWPANLDAIIAAPSNHKILMENDKVRVFEITLGPMEKEAFHYHQCPSVLYIQEAGDFIDYDSDGKIIVDTRLIKPSLKFPMTIWKDAEAAHSLENLSKTKPIRLIRVEMKN